LHERESAPKNTRVPRVTSCRRESDRERERESASLEKWQSATGDQLHERESAPKNIRVPRGTSCTRGSVLRKISECHGGPVAREGECSEKYLIFTGDQLHERESAPKNIRVPRGTSCTRGRVLQKISEFHGGPVAREGACSEKYQRATRDQLHERERAPKNIRVPRGTSCTRGRVLRKTSECHG